MEPCLLSDILITPPHGLTKQVSSHYLPYLVPHQLVPLEIVDPTPSSAPPPSLAPPTQHHQLSPDEQHNRDIRLRNLMLNTDGFGIAAYTTSLSTFTNPLSSDPSLAPTIYKSPQPIYNDTNFVSLASNTETTCLLAHVRAGSGAPVTTLNCHPFVFGVWSVMHNGSIADFAQLRRPLLRDLSSDVYNEVKGGTDSEVIAANVIDILTSSRGHEAWNTPAASVNDVFEAVQATLRKIVSTHRAITGDKGEPHPSSLNICVTDGTQLVATRFRNSADEQPPSLYWSRSAGVTLNRKFPGHPDAEVHERMTKEGSWGQVKESKEHGEHVIVASEPSTFVEKDWALLPKNSALVVDKTGKAEVRPLEVS